VEAPLRQTQSGPGSTLPATSRFGGEATRMRQVPGSCKSGHGIVQAELENSPIKCSRLITGLYLV